MCRGMPSCPWDTCGGGSGTRTCGIFVGLAGSPAAAAGTPRDPGVQHEQDARQDLAVIRPPAAGMISRRAMTGSSGSIRAHSSSGTIHGGRCPFLTARPNHHINTGIPTGHSVRSS